MIVYSVVVLGKSSVSVNVFALAVRLYGVQPYIAYLAR